MKQTRRSFLTVLLKGSYASYLFLPLANILGRLEMGSDNTISEPTVAMLKGDIIHGFNQPNLHIKLLRGNQAEAIVANFLKIQEFFHNIKIRNPYMVI